LFKRAGETQPVFLRGWQPFDLQIEKDDLVTRRRQLELDPADFPHNYIVHVDKCEHAFGGEHHFKNRNSAIRFINENFPGRVLTKRWKRDVSHWLNPVKMAWKIEDYKRYYFLVAVLSGKEEWPASEGSYDSESADAAAWDLIDKQVTLERRHDAYDRAVKLAGDDEISRMNGVAQ
jgi:hypothetical protein